MPDGGPFTNCTITDTLIMKAPDQSNHVDLKVVQPTETTNPPSTGVYLQISKGLKLEEYLYENYDNSVRLLPCLFNTDHYNPSTDADTVPLLRINRGMQFRDTGQIITVTGVGETKIQRVLNRSGIPSDYQTNDWPVLFATKVSRTDRYVALGDPVLATDKGFFVEKDFATFGFVSSTSDPEKQYGGGAIHMGTGLTGPGCPSLFNLSGVMLAQHNKAIDMYPHGSSLPSSGSTGDVFYNTSNKLIYQYGVITDVSPYYLGTYWYPSRVGNWYPIGSVDTIGSYKTSAPNTNDPKGSAKWWYDSTNKVLMQGFNPSPMLSRVYSGEYDTLFLTRADYPDSGPVKSANLHLGALTATTGLNIPTLTALDADEDNRPEGSLWLRTDL